MENKIKTWENLTNEIVANWIYKYFEIDDDEDIYFDWVQIGEVFQFADYWFSFSTILECYKLNVAKEQLFSWYDSSLQQGATIPLSDFILSPKKRLKKEQKYLQELRERVLLAQNEFDKALEEFKK